MKRINKEISRFFQKQLKTDGKYTKIYKNVTKMRRKQIFFLQNIRKTKNFKILSKILKIFQENYQK